MTPRFRLGYVPAWLLSFAVSAAAAAAQSLSGEASDAAGKQARATRVTDGSVRLDGRLDDDSWTRATPITDFVQKEPTEGIDPTDRMEVRFVYDAAALYVGARMWSRDPLAIQAPLGRRDAAGQAESFIVALDTYLDRRTAYGFGVTASGVRLDSFFPRDDETSADAGFDPVWEAKTAIDETGWTAELWIPFSQLRFNELAEQVWGLNVHRFIPTLNEDDYWLLIPRTDTAWASRFGELRGLDGIQPSKRLEVLPYLSGSSTLTGRRDERNPFDDGKNLASRVGVDVRMGLGSSLTLDVTVNPDFGQVEADPAEVNLTAFDTIFPEKRPFFTEGARLLSLELGGPMFNSRRIGLRPTRSVTGDYVDYPASSTILAAAKITGRTSSNTSIGVLAAVTDEESARVSSLGVTTITDVRVAPRTTYMLSRIGQQFGPAGSTANLLVTAVHRDFFDGDPLASLMPRNAFAAGGEAILRFKDGEYQSTLLGAMNHVVGSAAAIERMQRSSAHLFQRPDRSYSKLDPTRTSMDGYRSQAGLERRSGTHWLWDMAVLAQSPGMDFNDIGRTFAGDSLQYNANLRFRETRPATLLRNYSFVFATRNEWDYGGDKVVQTLRPSVNVTLRNFWTASAGLTRTFRAVDFGLTRGGPLMGRPSAWSVNGTLGNAATAQTKWNGALTMTSDENGGMVRRATGSFAFRPGPRWQLSVDPVFDHTSDSQQYVTTIAGGRAETFGSRYVFAYIDRQTISAQIRMGFTFKPDLNLDVYAEPFTASGEYADFGELLRPGDRARLTYGTAPDTTAELQPNGDRIVTAGTSRFTLANADFNVRSFRSNMVLRWEWRPGSTLYLVWQQNREQRDAIGARTGVRDLFGGLTAPGGNALAIKTSFWLPVR